MLDQPIGSASGRAPIIASSKEKPRAKKYRRKCDPPDLNGPGAVEYEIRTTNEPMVLDRLGREILRLRGKIGIQQADSLVEEHLAARTDSVSITPPTEGTP